MQYTHLYKIKLWENLKNKKKITFGTPSGESIDIYHVYKGIKVNINRREMKVDLIPLPLKLHDFDVILGMDWLDIYRAQMNCFEKTVSLQRSNGRRVIFRGERNVLPNYTISAITVRKIMRKECEAYLAYVMNSNKKNIELSNLPIVREFF